MPQHYEVALLPPAHHTRQVHAANFPKNCHTNYNTLKALLLSIMSHFVFSYRQKRSRHSSLGAAKVISSSHQQSHRSLHLHMIRSTEY